MRSVYFTDHHDKFRKLVREFLEIEVVPYAAAWEEAGALPRSLWRLLGAQGYLGLLHSAEVGGTGQDLFTSVVFLEELGRLGFGGVRAAISAHAYMATHYLIQATGGRLSSDYLAPAVAGDRIAALAITEPGCGADLSGLATTAEHGSGHFTVRGVKSMVSNGMAADFQVVAVRTAPAVSQPRGATGLSLLVVDAALPGVSAVATPTLGWGAAGTATVTYTDVLVPEDALIGEINSGFYRLMNGLQLERLVAAALAVGGIDRGLNDLREFMIGRRLGGGRLAELQAPVHRFADLATEAAAASELVHRAAWLYAQGRVLAVECLMAKLHATELACRVADQGLQLQGSHGYLASSAAARHYRDARAATIAAGPSEVMRDIIGRSLLRDGWDER